MLSGKTAFSGYSVAPSPFRGNLLAVATSQYYGIAGNGRVVVIDLDRGLSPVVEFATKDGCFDVSWSEKNETVLAAATGDGSVKIFQTSHPGSRPVLSLEGHSAETYSVDWNSFQRDLLCSASWDRSVRVWDASTGRGSTNFAHAAIAYEARWSPRNEKLIASVGGDGILNLWDTGVARNALSIKAHPNSEALCLDWSKYSEYSVATGSVDRSIRIWDLRNPGSPISDLPNAHLLAVRRVKFSPFDPSCLASCSYDMTVKVHDLNTVVTTEPSTVFNHHSEFVVGLGWSPLRPGLLLSAGWDRTVAAWTAPPKKVFKKTAGIRLAAA